MRELGRIPDRRQWVTLYLVDGRQWVTPYLPTWQWVTLYPATHRTKVNKLSLASSFSAIGCAVADPTNDTDPRVQAMLIAGFRRMSPGEKLARVSGMSQMVKQLALCDVRRRHPTADARELRLRVASRWLDAETMRRAFGWDPRVQGY